MSSPARPQTIRRAIEGIRAAAGTGQQTLAASGSPWVSPADSLSRPEALRHRHDKWQFEILGYGQSIPEVGGVAMRVSDASSRVRWVVRNGSEQARALGQRIIDSLDKPRMMRLLFLSGDVYVFMSREGDEDRNLLPGDLYVLSVAEVERKQDKVSILGADGKWQLTDDSFFRIWYPSDTNAWLATSPNQSAMDLLQAMYLHQIADSGVATSRIIGAGILTLPTTLPNIPTRVDGKPAPGSQQEMIEKLSAGMRRAVEPRNRLEAAMPFILAIDSDAEEKHARPELLRLDKDDRAGEYAERYDEYSKRYYEAIQWPIESMQGMSGANAIAGQHIREDMVREFLLPMMEPPRAVLEQRVLKMIDPDLVLELDTVALVSKPDQTATIMELLSLDVVTPESAKEAIVTQDLTRLVMVSAPERTYNSNVIRSTPSDMKPGGERGGGSFRNRA